MAMITVIARDVATDCGVGAVRITAEGNGPVLHEIRDDHYCGMCRVEGAHGGAGLGEAKVEGGARHLEARMLGGGEACAAAVGGSTQEA